VNVPATLIVPDEAKTRFPFPVFVIVLKVAAGIVCEDALEKLIVFPVTVSVPFPGAYVLEILMVPLGSVLSPPLMSRLT
jgi:hypothetical protein